MRDRQHLIDDLTVKDTWRLFHILSEFVDGFEVMPEVYPAVSIFGSSKTSSNSPIYKNTVKISEMLVKNGFNIISGGGPGVMEAANKGASQAGGKSVSRRLNAVWGPPITPFFPGSTNGLYGRRVVRIRP